MSKKKSRKQRRAITFKPLLPVSISKNAGGLKVYLEMDGKPPKYLKVYTDGESKGEVYRSSDKKEFTKIETNFSMQIYELIYRHISGSDIEHWMLWERREDFLKYCR